MPSNKMELWFPVDRYLIKGKPVKKVGNQDGK